MQTHPHSYLEGMPAEIRPMIEHIAEASKDAPWYATYDHMRGLEQMAFATFSDDGDTATEMHSYMVSAVLEQMGVGLHVRLLSGARSRGDRGRARN